MIRDLDNISSKKYIKKNKLPFFYSILFLFIKILYDKYFGQKKISIR